MSTIAMNTAKLIDMLPESDQNLAYELIKKLVLAWDPDFTKLTEEEVKSMEKAENSGFISEKDIDWDHLEKYV